PCWRPDCALGSAAAASAARSTPLPPPRQPAPQGGPSPRPPSRIRRPSPTRTTASSSIRCCANPNLGLKKPAMHHFHYKDGVLHAEDVSLARLAAEVGTPFYCYSTATLARHYRVLTEAFADQDALICFAVKANSNQAVLRTLGKLGAGMDVVSEGELRRALAAGVPASRIIFAGVGKTRAEMAYALEQGILGFTVESEPELRALSEVAAGLGKTARIALRVNPDV